FGGEVERILSMVDGVLLLVDAAEGPMPQTKFVTGKALALGLKPIVVINKVDRPDQRGDAVLNEIFDLFVALDANEEQLDFPVMYASAKQGWAASDAEGPKDDLSPLFEIIIERVAPPNVDPTGEFKMLATTLVADPYLGRLLTGKIEAGSVALNQTVKAISRDGTRIEETRVTKIMAYHGLERQTLEVAHAGDIVAIAGFQKATVADTLCGEGVSDPIPAQPIDPPTLAMTFLINDSPLCGLDGKKVTSRAILERLQSEAEGNVALRIAETNDANAFEVSGRGELQLAVLIETMRREGFELSISRPRVVYQQDPETGGKLEPIEEVYIDVDEEFSGAVVEKLAARKADLIEMKTGERGKQRLVFRAPSRALIGYHGEFMTDTRGTGVLNRIYHGYAPYRGALRSRRAGVLISMATGKSVAFALWNLEERGSLFVGAGEQIYDGMIIGEHNRGNDLEVNPMKAKQLTNMRASGKDEAVALTTPMPLTLDKAIAYIGNDELVEVTPNHIRLRKRHLDPHERRKANREAEVA
ncbi:MAG: translational GTPase TypA, partial [Rhodospirillales bacterium]|nr:translational GTPase TypA [Rhodospirillales bacterium]